jgi:hypothetical protein
VELIWGGGSHGGVSATLQGVCIKEEDYGVSLSFEVGPLEKEFYLERAERGSFQGCTPYSGYY